MNDVADQTRPVSKKMLWAGWIISALPSLFMLFGAAYSLIKPEVVKESMDKYGYPANTATPIIIVEVVCVLIYLIPRTSVLGAILLTGYLGGATATHVRASEPFFFPVIIGVLLWLGIYLRDGRLRALIPLRRSAV